MFYISSKVLKSIAWVIGMLISFGVFAQSSGIQNQEPLKFVNLNINDGLCDNRITSILKDSRGFMWFGTQQGLNRYDGIRIRSFLHDTNDSTSIPFSQIIYIYEDCDQRLWIRNEKNFTIYNPSLESFTLPANKFKDTNIPTNGLRQLFADRKGNTWLINSNNILYKYSNEDGTTDSIRVTPLKENSNNYLNQLSEDSEGNLWAVTYIGEVVQINPNTKEIVQQLQMSDTNNDLYVDYQLFIDSEDNVWIFTRGQNIGTFILSKESGEIIHLMPTNSGDGISSNMVTSVSEDEQGYIWLAMGHGGINILDKELNIVSRISSRNNDKYSLAQNSLSCLYRDNENIIWAGTYKEGISYHHKDLIPFHHYQNSAELPNSLPYNDISCFAEDNKNNIWIGTDGGGLIYFNRQNNTFKTYKHNPDNSNSLSTDIIVSIFIDRNEILWIGTYQGGLNSFDGTNFTHYFHDAKDSTSISDNRVWDIYEDSKQNLWIGTFNGGLNLLDRETCEFIHYKAGENSIGSNFVMSIVEDSENKLWMGTTYGLSVRNLNTKQFFQYPPSPNVPGGHSGKHVRDIHEDARGLIWLATSQGLNVFDKREGKFKAFTELDGLNNSSILTILEDMKGNLWVSTYNGISKITVKDYSSQSPISELQIDVENFGLQDGLQGNEFNQKAAYRTRSGELIYGGTNGFNLFYPGNISEYESKEEIVLTNFKVFNQDVQVNVPFRNRIILEKSISYENQIKLKHNENVFSFEFATLNFFHPEKSRFQYKLSGFNKEWLDVNDGFNEITFTNIDAGTYQLKIRSSNDNNSWKEMSPPLSIEILPPFWQSTYAYLLYFLLVTLILIVILRTLSEHQRLKFAAENERREAERIQQVDALKTKFFTNISHEFRTPLSLIISPLGKMIEKTKSTDQRNHLILIQRNARRLQLMVNQLLDFRKMELQKIEVKTNLGELIGFIREIGSSFEDLVESKQISYKFTSNCEQLFTHFDKDKTDKIITNLLSNALKFTPNGGKVKLEILHNENADSHSLHIEISDTGIGIPLSQQTHIFDRFYQTGQAGTEINQGSGIGLSMVKEYLTLLGGSIEVESVVEQGSIFTVTLPVQPFTESEIESLSKEELPVATTNLIKQPKLEIEKNRVFDKSKKTIIIVEDNADFRFYLADNLKTKYNILESENGAQGWELILSTPPDLIVSDVMMPEMDGVELCKKVKSHRNTKHIPLILLTAKSEAEPVVKGYKSGADGYITKPFDFRVLESRIENLINTREQLRLSFQSMMGINPEKIEVNSEDEQFIKKALLVVETKISEASFTVEDFGREMGMSRVSLYKKLLALTDKSPIEFIRIIRLKRATDILISSQLSVSEVAYQVGFNSPRYFSKYFAKQYNMLPSEYISKHRNSNVDISDEMKEKYN